MKNSIIWFLLILLLPLNCYAETIDIKLQYNVTGATCGHIHIKDLNNNVLLVTTEDVLMSPIDQSDPDIIQLLKKYIQNNNLTLTSFKKIKTGITLFL